MSKELNINTSMLEERQFLNIKDLKEILGMSQSTIYRICDRKELNKYKFRGENRFRSEDVKSYLIGKGILKWLVYQKVDKESIRKINYIKLWV